MCSGGRLCSGPRRAGHDAVGAELVAADHDADVRLERRRPHRRIAQRVVALEAGRRPRAAPPSARPRLTAQLRLAASPATSSTSSGTRASCPVPTTISTCGARWRISSWSFWAMQPSTPMTLSGLRCLWRAEPAEGGVDLVLGVLADGAGVEEDDVGVGRRRRSARSPGGAGCRRPARCRARSSGSRRFRCRVSWSWPHRCRFQGDTMSPFEFVLLGRLTLILPNPPGAQRLPMDQRPPGPFYPVIRPRGRHRKAFSVDPLRQLATLK